MIHRSTPRKAIFSCIVCVLLNNTLFPLTFQNYVLISANQSTYDIEILLLLDHQYGRSYFAIRQLLEQYGWNVTTTSVNPVLIPCPGLDPSQVLTVDVLIQNITDVTEYDCISVLAGVGHPSLIASQETLNLIQTAVEAELIVSGWCTGVRVLAAADVIRGKNVTGSIMYREEYEAAGATYIEDENPIIDGNIVTVGRSRFYRDEMGRALATALGVYESNPPEILNIVVTPDVTSPYSQISIISELTEESGVLWIKAKFFNQSDGIRDSEPVLTLLLNNPNEDNTYIGNTTELDLGNYTIDLHVNDIFNNKANYTDVCSILVTNQPTDTTINGMSTWQVVIISALIIIPTSCLVILGLKKRIH